MDFMGHVWPLRWTNNNWMAEDLAQRHEDPRFESREFITNSFGQANNTVLLDSGMLTRPQHHVVEAVAR